MRYEVVESDEGWIVCRDGVRLACFSGQVEALEEVTRHLQEARHSGSVSLAMRYQRRAG